MDGRRFDELARGMAAPSRRGVLRGAGVAAVGGVLARLGLREAAAACKRYGRPCSSGAQCCSGTCTGGICRCGAGQVTCQAAGGTTCVDACPGGQVLAAGCQCVCESNGHPPVEGSCPGLVCPELSCLQPELPPICDSRVIEEIQEEVPCFCVRDTNGDDACVLPCISFSEFFIFCETSGDCAPGAVCVAIPQDCEIPIPGLCLYPCDVPDELFNPLICLFEDFAAANAQPLPFPWLR
jgi:hypothetical protein